MAEDGKPDQPIEAVKPAEKEFKFTRKRLVFLEEYLVTWNATEAARRAGFKHPDRQGPRLLGIVVFQEAIQKRMEEKAMRANEVLERLAQQARVNVGDFIKMSKQVVTTKDGSTYEVEIFSLDWDEIKVRGHLIKSISATAYGPKIELHDGQSALVHLGKHLKLFTEVQEHSGKLTLVEMTMDEWKANQAKREADVNQMAADFEESEDA